MESGQPYALQVFAFLISLVPLFALAVVLLFAWIFGDRRAFDNSPRLVDLGGLAAPMSTVRLEHCVISSTNKHPLGAQRVAAFFLQRNGFALPFGAFNGWRTSGLALAVGGIMILLVMLSTITLAALLRSWLPLASGNFLGVRFAAQLIAYGVSIPILLYGLPRVAGVPLRTLGFPRRHALNATRATAGDIKRFVLVVIVAAAIMIACVDCLGIYITRAFAPHVEMRALTILRQTHGLFLQSVAVLMITMVAPIAEELFFRALIFNGLYARYQLWVAAAISGAVFAAAHGNGYMIVPLWLGGCLLAFVYAYSKNILSPIAVHAFFNAAGLIIAVYL